MNAKHVIWTLAGVGVLAMGIVALNVDLWPKMGGPGRTRVRVAEPGAGSPAATAQAPGAVANAPTKPTADAKPKGPVSAPVIATQIVMAQVLDPETGEMKEVPCTASWAPMALPTDIKAQMTQWIDEVPSVVDPNNPPPEGVQFRRRDLFNMTGNGVQVHSTKPGK